MLFVSLTLGFAAIVGNAVAKQYCRGDTAPEQIHYNYMGCNGMMISWNTKCKLDKPTVKYGKGQSLDKTASSDVSVTYKTSTTYRFVFPKRAAVFENILNEVECKFCF